MNTITSAVYERSFWLAQPFDLYARAEGSNQKRQFGLFPMLARQVVVSGHMTGRDGVWVHRLGVEGRRYKPDGTLGRPRAYALISRKELSSEVWAEIAPYVPAELGGSVAVGKS